MRDDIYCCGLWMDSGFYEDEGDEGEGEGEELYKDDVEVIHT